MSKDLIQESSLFNKNDFTKYFNSLELDETNKKSKKDKKLEDEKFISYFNPQTRNIPVMEFKNKTIAKNIIHDDEDDYDNVPYYMQHVNKYLYPYFSNQQSYIPYIDQLDHRAPFGTNGYEGNSTLFSLNNY